MTGDNTKKRKHANGGGIGFSDPYNTDYEMATPTGPEKHSSAFLGLQGLQKEMYDDIKKSFIGEEERKFQKRWDKKMKEDMRHEAKLDLQMENKKLLKEERMRIEVEVGEELGKVRGELEGVKEKLRVKEKELRGLRERCVCGVEDREMGIEESAKKAVEEAVIESIEGEGGFEEEREGEGEGDFVFRKLTRREEKELTKEEFNAYRHELMARVRSGVLSKKPAKQAAAANAGTPQLG